MMTGAHRLTAANAAYLEKKTNSSSAKLISKIIVINATLIEEFSTLAYKCSVSIVK